MTQNDSLDITCKCVKTRNKTEVTIAVSH